MERNTIGYVNIGYLSCRPTICEKYANGGIGELIRIASDVGSDDLFRGYAKKLRELIETKSK